MEGPTWNCYFHWKTNAYYGSVLNNEDAIDLIREFSYATCTSYNVTRCSRNFGKFDGVDKNSTSKHLIRFNDDGRIKRGTQVIKNGMPFIVVGSKYMECHQGPNRRKSATEKKKKGTAAGDHNYKTQPAKKKATGSKKRGCKAFIYLREIVFFPGYKLPRDTSYWREKMSSSLRKDLQSQEVDFLKYIYIDLPEPHLHSDHIGGMAADIKAPIDSRLVKHLNNLVEEGIYNTKEIQRNLKILVKDLFQEVDNKPNQFNRRFYPSKGDIQKLVYRMRRKLQHSLIDQENLNKKAEDWRRENKGDLIFLRLSASIESPQNDDDAFEDVTDNNQTLIVYQSTWQKRLLTRYGNEVVFLDATYRTTRYALPLFFLCVQTNSGYCVVGSFIVENEDSKSVAEALSILKKNNPEWMSKSFMIDASEIESNAIQMLFPESDIYICDFHRKQAWLRWTSTLKNDVQSPEAILDMLNKVAESLTIEEYIKNRKQLEENPLWIKQPRLQEYINKQWFANDRFKSWVWAYRKGSLTLVVHTNNGVESQNKVFKHEYLAPFRVKSVTYLMTVMIEDYFVDAHRKYLSNNVTMSAGWREPVDSLPVELHHRPLYLIRHMRNSSMNASSITKEMIIKKDDSNFLVTSSKKATNHYNVFLGSDIEQQMPHCDCYEYQRNHMPCKHFVAVFQHVPNISWDSLPDFYRNNPHFTVDTQCVELCSFPHNGVEDVDRHDVNVCDDFSPVEEPQHEANTTLDLHRSAKKVREVIQRLNNLTYIVDSVEKLEEVRIQLQDIATDLVKSSPSCEGLLLEPSSTPYKKKKTLKRKATAVLKDLPTRKKRKVSISSRRGRKQKKNPLISGVTYDILTDEKNEVHVDDVHLESAMQSSKKHKTVTWAEETRLCDYRYFHVDETQEELAKESGGSEKKIKNKKIAIDSSNCSSQKVVKLQTGDAQEFVKNLRNIVGCGVAIPVTKGSRYHVCGDVLDDQDFKSLRGNNWLNDKVINAFLSYLKEEQNQTDMDHVFVMPSYLAVLWQNDRFHWMYSKVKLSLFKWIFVPICIGNHWILLVANTARHEVSVLDSLNNPKNQRVINKWRQFLRLRMDHVDELQGEWKTGGLRSSQQTDGHSCGPFVLLNAMAIIKHVETTSLNTEHAILMRRYVEKKLLQVAKKPPAQRTVCDMVGCIKPQKRSLRWISCHVCGRWLHFICANITIVPEDDYVCLICRSQYE